MGTARQSHASSCPRSACLPMGRCRTWEKVMEPAGEKVMEPAGGGSWKNSLKPSTAASLGCLSLTSLYFLPVARLWTRSVSVLLRGREA